MQGYIKLYRKMLEWEWYTDIPVRILFEHCLLKANHKNKKWQGRVIEAGSFITSYEKLSVETGLTIRQVRTALNKLKMTNELTHEGYSQYSIISIKNWFDYQENDKQNDKQMTNERQTKDKRATTTKNDKNEKNINEVVVVEEKNLQQLLQKNQKIYGEFQNVCLTDEKYQKLLGICMSEKLLNELIEQLSEKIGTGDESPYNADCPDAHYIRLRAYYNFRLKNPDKFKTPEQTSRKAFNEFYEKEKARLAAKGIY